MSRIIRLTENDLARIVRRVIMEQPSLPQPEKTPLTLPQPLKTVVYKDQAATKIETNIDIDSSSIRLQGTSVWFDFYEAGFKHRPSSGHFNCSTNNQVHLIGDEFPEKLYLSLKRRAWIFKSKCGKSQGYVSTNTVVDTNLA
jgi:hypothetical protein